MTASSSSSTKGWNHDVFLSFRGRDTRKNFTSHLYNALSSTGINTFIDNEIESGEEISDSLVKVIKSSRISIVIFSRDYASSSYCLDELVEIWECRESNRQVILPIFYKVEPTDVQELSGSYGEALAKHEADSDSSRLHKWRFALVQVSNLAGEPYRDSEDLDEATFINRIVKKVSDKLDRKLLDVAEHPIGLDSHIQCIESKLDVGSHVVKMVGIWGMGGIGKTTLAKAIYNRFAHQFEASSFVLNVRERSSKCDGIAKLQEEILYDTVGYEKSLMGNFERGISLIKERLRNKRVLIVIDDVAHKDQLNKLVGGLNWFGGGTRIIITTRDQYLLLIHQVAEKYELREMCSNDALELFSWNAFKKSQPVGDFIEFSQRIVKHVRGLPLALIVLGSSLFCREMFHWEEVLKELNRIPNKDITEKLRISYDDLEDEEQNIFLEIACFFKGWNKDELMNMLDALGYTPRWRVQILIERSLLYLDGRNRIEMHDLIQRMGRDIAKSNPSGKRLCLKDDILNLLSNHSKENHHDIKGMMLDLSGEEEVEIDAEIFEKMMELRVLMIHNAKFLPTVSKQQLPIDLKCFNWFGYITSNALKIFPKILVQPIEQLLQAINDRRLSRTIISKMKFKNLIIMDFESCTFLYSTPNFSAIPNLKQLKFLYCPNLEEINESITSLEKLQVLDFFDCTSLRSFPSFSESTLHKNLKDLKRMRFRFCSSLREIPDLSAIPNLEMLDLYRCYSLEKIDESVGFLEKINYLSLQYCFSLRRCPSLVKLKSLQSLGLDYCSELAKFPTTIETITDVTYLDLSGTAIVEIPSSIEHFTQLEKLRIRECRNLVSISNRIYKLQHLRELRISDCPKLGKFPRHHEEEVASSSSTPSSNGLFPKLKHLDIHGCNFEEYNFLNIHNCFQVLEELDLSRNDLAKADFPNILNCFQRLGKLDLSRSNLLQVHFSEIPNCFQVLWWLDLSMNNLANVDFLKSPEYLPLLKRLFLSGNNFVCIPKSIYRFANLTYLDVSFCKQLIEIPELPPSLEGLNANDCKSLERVSQLTSIRRGHRFYLSNCHKLAENVGENWIIEIVENISRTAIKCPFQEDDIAEDLLDGMFSERLFMVLPQDTIPKWFKYSNEGHFLSFKMPSDLISENLIGIAFYFIFESQEIRKFSDARDELFYVSINDGHPLGLGGHPTDLESNHMWLSFLRGCEDLPLLPNDKVSFEVSTKVRSCLENWTKINCKRCGAHLVYKMDGERSFPAITSSISSFDMKLLDNNQGKGKEMIQEEETGSDSPTQGHSIKITSFIVVEFCVSVLPCLYDSCIKWRSGECSNY